MRAMLFHGQHWRSLGLSAVSLFVCLLGGSFLLLADTPQELRTLETGTCYCHCSGARAHHACVKICETPKYASRPWATNCAKPRMRLPLEKRDAGPRFEHPGRNERASDGKLTTAS
jgi:hypothetical protein